IAAQNEQITMLSTVVAAAPQQSAPLATVEVQDAAPITTEEAMIEPLATEAAIAQPLATEAAESDAVATGDLPERALFRISSDESEARFRIDEKLMGNPNEVVGITSQVGGDIIVNYQNPSLSQVGTIVINARTIKTDNEFRNQSIRGQILESSKDEYEFINFTPTEILNAPSEPVEVGETVNFQVVGDLQIKDVTRSVTFDIALTAAAVDRIEGLASVTVLYADFGLRINAPPTVSEIGDSVILELDFVASRVEE
ncbi:MAG TPA: YceI family protein, partial [Aggregatilineales bacterium]|nr:YceI family protein [Aggregatilineales bacterium]